MVLSFAFAPRAPAGRHPALAVAPKGRRTASVACVLPGVDPMVCVGRRFASAGRLRGGSEGPVDRRFTCAPGAPAGDPSAFAVGDPAGRRSASETCASLSIGPVACAARRFASDAPCHDAGAPTGRPSASAPRTLTDRHLAFAAVLPEDRRPGSVTRAFPRFDQLARIGRRSALATLPRGGTDAPLDLRFACAPRTPVGRHPAFTAGEATGRCPVSDATGHRDRAVRVLRGRAVSVSGRRESRALPGRRFAPVLLHPDLAVPMGRRPAVVRGDVDGLEVRADARGPADERVAAGQCHDHALLGLFTAPASLRPESEVR
ncbi:hypothetical protein SAMN05216270_115138 [Glycomyces harbinensis]|uniref:Uncharacterized protein n=1 Tax=Glycomyces harbinensis TaxID=58114 RepID=A0A1G7B446_9ACTN|nr:hypothetical protein SAMN05216270_115138 [Glycomyces harbinensis]